MSQNLVCLNYFWFQISCLNSRDWFWLDGQSAFKKATHRELTRIRERIKWQIFEKAISKINRKRRQKYSLLNWSLLWRWWYVDLGQRFLATWCVAKPDMLTKLLATRLKLILLSTFVCRVGIFTSTVNTRFASIFWSKCRKVITFYLVSIKLFLSRSKEKKCVISDM